MQGSGPSTLSQDLPPLPSPLCLFIHARNVNSYRAVKKKNSFSLLSRFSYSERNTPTPLSLLMLYFPCLLHSVLAEAVTAQS